MKTNIPTQKFILLCLLCLATSCIQKKKANDIDLYFPKRDNIISFQESDLFKNKIVTPLEINNEALIGGYPSMLLDSSFFIYSRNGGGKVFCFDKTGKFMRTIGAIGNGPEEYTELTDICLDTKGHSVEILSLNSVYRYTYEGDFIRKIPIEYPAFSFYRENDSCYWLYTGNNRFFSDYKLFKVSTISDKVEKYLKSDLNLLPISENNFHKNGEYTSFHESYNNSVYLIEKGIFSNAHTISFDDLNMDLSNAPEDPMDFIPYLKQKHYATIRCFLENKEYIYVQVFENIPQNTNGRFYHWFINKKTKKNTVVEQPQDVAPDSYLYAPQILTADNHLYFIGYPLEKEGDLANTDENPSIVIINVSTL